MSTLKKIGALIMALAMCLALAMPAFAADARTSGSITVTNAKETVTVKEGDEDVSKDNAYTAYMIFAASPAGDSKDSKVDGKPTASADGHAGYYATEDQKTYWEGKGLFDFQKAGNDSYIVSLHKKGVDEDGKDIYTSAKEIAEYFNNKLDEVKKYEKDNKVQILGTGVELTYKDGKATATNVPFGYYFISSNNGSVVSIDTTNFDVKIEDKNTYGDTGFEPGDDNEDGKLKDIVTLNGKNVTYLPDTNNDGKKETPAVSVKIGDVVSYRVSAKTTNYVVLKDKDGKTSSEKVQYVYINDVLDDGLDYEGDITVTVAGKTPVTAPVVTKEGRAFTVAVPWLDADGNALYDDGAVVNVEYSAKVNDQIKMVGENGAASDNAGNTANVKYDSTPTQDYKPDPDDPTKPTPDPNDPTPPNPNPNPGEGGHDTGVAEIEVSVYSYALAIQKVDANDKHVLPDAHFNVSDGTNTLKFTKNTTDGCYYYDANGDADVFSDAEGEIVLKGVSAGTYTVTETAAPAGYNLMTDTPSFKAIEAGVTITSKKVTTTAYFEPNDNGTYVKKGEKFVLGTEEELAKAEHKYNLVDTKTDEAVEGITTTGNDVFSENAHSMIVENGQGTELPSTGGIGTTIFYVVGGAMVIGAGVLLITKKRMAE